MKTGRNDPCPCGSGQKYKKCCSVNGSPPAAEQNNSVKELMTLAIECHQTGRLDEAAAGYRQILAISPRHGDATHLLGVVEYQMGNFETAIDLIKRAIPLLPGFAETYINLGAVYKDMGRLADAVSCLHKSLTIQPSHLTALMNLGDIYVAQIKLDKALECFCKAVTISPDNAAVLSSKLFLLQYDTQQTEATLATAHQEWECRHGKPALRYTQYKNERSLERPLRIGYVSPDFGQHPVGFFISPVLKGHDRNQVEVFCYSDRSKEDVITIKLRGYADVWRESKDLSHQSLAELVRTDRIDILIDLAGHTINNRLPVFSLKPAPLQVTWLGYPGSTGLSAIDYRLTDAVADPAPVSDQYASETLIRLPDGFLCYEPPEAALAVMSSPVLASNRITFGSFNNLMKVDYRVINLWAAILSQTPNSRLILKSYGLANADVCRHLLVRFQAAGIDSNRIELRAFTATLEEHFSTYGEIDIALDTFPYNGTTTSFEALWMGVPVVTLAGSRHATRVGASILTRIGLTDLVTATEKDYIDTAVRLAGDLPMLGHLRQTLRERLSGARFCNATAFTASLETAFRGIWQTWCNKH